MLNEVAACFPGRVSSERVMQAVELLRASTAYLLRGATVSEFEAVGSLGVSRSRNGSGDTTPSPKMPRHGKGVFGPALDLYTEGEEKLTAKATKGVHLAVENGIYVLAAEQLTAAEQLMVAEQLMMQDSTTAPCPSLSPH